MGSGFTTSQNTYKKDYRISTKPFIEIVGKILDITKEEGYLKNNVKKIKAEEYKKTD